MKRFAVHKATSALASVSIFALVLAGCQQAPEPAPSASPVALVSPVETSLPVTTADPAEEKALFAALTEQYQADVEASRNGYPIVEPFLKGELPEGMGEDLYELSLESSEEQAAFDSKLLPTLKNSFSKPIFVPKSELVAGDTEVNYRGLRHLVGLLTQRAEQVWEKGDKQQALELAQLPLNLSSAMRVRPETASVNLFSSNYSEATLALIPSWMESGNMDPESVDDLRSMLEASSPDYAHLRETVSVDFAQLLNSLDSEKGREMLGIGQVEPSTLELWKKQLLAIHGEAVRLYDEAPLDPAAFNQSVRAASGPIQGLVIDYPEVATMQKHWFAKYKASELGLALLGPKGPELSKLDSEQLIGEVLQDDQATEDAVKALLEIKIDQESIVVMGQPGQFELLAPGVEPVFFEHRHALGTAEKTDS